MYDFIEFIKMVWILISSTLAVVVLAFVGISYGFERIKGSYSLRGVQPDPFQREPVGLLGGRLSDAVNEIMHYQDFGCDCLWSRWSG